jgi:hypothetical protein
MNIQIDWKERMEFELDQAEKARLGGNEGRARVCARRAAGAIAGEYLERRGKAPSGLSAYDRLRFFCSQTDLPLEVREVASHFLERITTEHDLPSDADLLAEARWLASTLFPDGE